VSRIFFLLRGDRSGSTAIEFGLIAPAFLAMLLGVFQVGIWMQSYNAMRNSIAETARNVSVQYQTGNKLTDSQIQDSGVAVASSSPYLLDIDETQVFVDKDGAPAQSILGARKMTLTIVYQPPSFLSVIGIDGPELNYTRPLFVET